MTRVGSTVRLSVGNWLTIAGMFLSNAAALLGMALSWNSRLAVAESLLAEQKAQSQAQYYSLREDVRLLAAGVTQLSVVHRNP